LDELACDIHNTIANQRELVWQNVRQLSEQQYRPIYMPLSMHNSTALLQHLHHHNLVGGIPTPLKNMKVSWADYSQYMGKTC
jgi:hypothetical protein